MRTRFAPAPTGFLHLGHVANAVYVWGLGAQSGASVLLRVEDHDRQRSRADFEVAMLDDLDWLGFEPDVFPTTAFRAGRCESRQSDRALIYAADAERLAAGGHLYGCTCSRRDAAIAAKGAYPGTCRDRGIPLDGDVRWRVRIDPGVESFDDRLVGTRRQDPSAELGDPVIRDRRGNWTYQFSVVVDDHRQGVDLVIRGQDLLASTGLQIRLARMIGRADPPAFAHHPLIMKSADQKLSKSDGATGIRDLRAAGWSAERVIGEAAWRVGLIDRAEPVRAADVARLVVRR